MQLDGGRRKVRMRYIRSHRLRRQLGTLMVIVLAPLLMQQTDIGDFKEAEYTELNPRWEYAGVVLESSLGSLAGVVACPGETVDENLLVAVDSSGTVTELRYVGDAWETVRTFAIGHPVCCVSAGAPQHDRKWRVYVGSLDGQVTELTRTKLGWTTNPVVTLDHPVLAIHTTNPGKKGISQLFVIDKAGHATNLWIGMNQDWQTRPIPDIDGGITDLVYSMERTGLNIIVAGPSGTLHQLVQDTMGFWSGDEWAAMAGGVLDMAASADPTMKDMAVYYSGDDGHFRYLFFDHKSDEASRVPVAGGASHLIGKQSSLRYNEFMGLSRDEYCQFEFNFTTREWDRVPLYRVGQDLVSVHFGQARPGHPYQFYVVTADGLIHEFVRQEMPEEAASGE
ncbi:MAG: hypothetical protein GF341_07935 [candidate division Zixibacteria bacterium]|nr:hypothetical protein [candidate division Zixibacteria bacterium]